MDWTKMFTDLENYGKRKMNNYIAEKAAESNATIYAPMARNRNINTVSSTMSFNDRLGKALEDPKLMGKAMSTAQTLGKIGGFFGLMNK